MHRLAFLYVPSVGQSEALEVFHVLEAYAFRITHIGKVDPPAKRSMAFEAAAQLIVDPQGELGTNYTFVRDKAAGIELSFTLHSEPRWECSTISFSYPKSIPASQLCQSLFQRIRSFACISGTHGGGKSQAWEVSLIAPDCPSLLRQKLGGA